MQIEKMVSIIVFNRQETKRQIKFFKTKFWEKKQNDFLENFWSNKLNR